MRIDTAMPAALPDAQVLPAPAVPRGSEDKPWERPADGGEPLGQGDFWYHDDAFGAFQGSDEIPGAVAHALRLVYERMCRAGFRDWESESDYVECSYWFMRRHLELNAREAFRLWYGDGEWEEPFRMASQLQETGQVEYRIDHLLTTELGVEVRKAERAKTPTDGDGRRKARYGELQRDFLKLAPTILQPAEFVEAEEIARRLQPHVEYVVHPVSLLHTLNRRGDLFVKQVMTSAKGLPKAHFALLPSPAL